MKERFLSEGWIACRLRRASHRIFFALVMAAVVLPLGYAAARIEAAAVWSAFRKPSAVRKALVFDPDNPRLYEQMGRLEQTSWDAARTEPVPWFRKAADLEPGNGLYWESLGQACQFAGNQICATNAFARALALDPMSPRAVWLAANNDLFSGAEDQAASRFRRLLALDPGYAGAVFAICLRAYGNPQSIGERILPAGSSPALKLDYVNFLTARNDFQDAAQYWSQLASSGAPLPFSPADPYLETLISSGRIDQAVRVWHDLQQRGALPADGDGDGDNGNLVFNPGFERKPLNAGFGWRFRKTLSVDVEFGDPSAHRGARSLRIDYAVAENRASEPIDQLIPMSHGRTYRLTAWVRTEEIGSGSGPRLRVVDAEHDGCLRAQTPAVVGTTPWHEVGATFTTCATTRLIRLSLWRPRSDDSPDAISGHLWLDDVSLKPMDGSGLASSRGGNPSGNLSGNPIGNR